MSIDLFGCTPGPHNSLMDIAGIGVGHAICDDGQGDSGVTVIATPSGATASVDVRGGGPGTRETDLLSPPNTVEAIHAIALCGGSAFGLDAATGAPDTGVPPAFLRFSSARATGSVVMSPQGPFLCLRGLGFQH